MPKRVTKPKTKKLPFQGRLTKPDANVRIHSFANLSFFVEMDSSLKKNVISDFGFDTNGPSDFTIILSRGCALFIGLSHDEAEKLTLDVFSTKLTISHAEKQHGLYAWTVIQDVIARLPFNNPMSRAIGKISKLHDEFPLGEMGIDSED